MDQTNAMHNMGAIVPLVSLILVAFAGRGSFTNVAAEDMTGMEYWQAVLPETPMPPAIHDLLTQSAAISTHQLFQKTGLDCPEDRSATEQREVHAVKGNHKRRLDSNMFAKGVRKFGPNSEDGAKDNVKKQPFWYGSGSAEDPKNFPFWYGSGSTEDVKNYPFLYGQESTKDLKQNLFFRGLGRTKDLKKYPFWYGPGRSEDTKKFPFWYESRDHDLNKFWVGNTKAIRKHPFWFRFRSSVEDLKKFQLESEHVEDNVWNQIWQNLVKISGSVPGGKNKIAIIDSEPIKGKRQHHHVGTGKDEKDTPAATDIFFFPRDVLRPGSVIMPAIPPTTWLPPLLPRHVADSIPFSAGHFADILAMFAPESHTMAGEMRWALEACERPGERLPGYKAAGCATSLESLAELPMALLRTRNVRAFSPDMAADSADTPARRGRYNVTAVKKLTEESPVIVTCHDTMYPYAVFFCHTASPTAAYAVTLVSEDGEAPVVMKALAVCHLGRSVQAHGDEPGEAKAGACHFLTKLSVIWVPAGRR
ncbi:unnamed protein product [Urochloa humidicola]